MDQLIFASLSHTHYWYEVGMLKVPAVIGNARSESQRKGSLSDDSDSTLGSFRVRLDLGLYNSEIPIFSFS